MRKDQDRVRERNAFMRGTESGHTEDEIQATERHTRGEDQSQATENYIQGPVRTRVNQ